MDYDNPNNNPFNYVFTLKLVTMTYFDFVPFEKSNQYGTKTKTYHCDLKILFIYKNQIQIGINMK